MDEKRLTADLEAAIDNDTKPPTPIRPLPPVDQQLAQMERIEHAIRNRIRSERLTIMAEYDRTVSEIRSVCERKISDFTAKATEEREQALRQLGEETAKRLHELGRLFERIERQ